MTDIAIVTGSVYGSAQFVAEEIATALNEAGKTAQTLENATINDIVNRKALIVVSSTTGSGDIPENLQPFYRSLNDQPQSLAELDFVVVALGDSSYLDSYCGAGKALHAALLDLGAKPLAEPLEIDALEVMTPEDEAVPFVQALV